MINSLSAIGPVSKLEFSGSFITQKGYLDISKSLDWPIQVGFAGLHLKEIRLQLAVGTGAAEDHPK